MNFILFGQKNSGKTHFGKLLAKKLNFFFIDTDNLIEVLYYQIKNKKISYKEIFKKEGEKYFRKLEKKVIFSLKNSKNSVIALGGGSILSKETQNFLKNFGKLIYLKISFETFLKRSENTYPSHLKKIFHERKKIFEKILSFKLDVDKMPLEKLLKRLSDVK